MRLDCLDEKSAAKNAAMRSMHVEEQCSEEGPLPNGSKKNITFWFITCTLLTDFL